MSKMFTEFLVTLINFRFPVCYDVMDDYKLNCHHTESLHLRFKMMIPFHFWLNLVNRKAIIIYYTFDGDLLLNTLLSEISIMSFGVKAREPCLMPHRKVIIFNFYIFDA